MPPAPSASPKLTVTSTVSEATLMASESHHHGGEDRRASSPSVARHDRGGAVSSGHHSTTEYENDSGKQRMDARPESIKNVALENDNDTVHENSSTLLLPTTTAPATPILETAMNVD
ncbi:hypothetical protein BG015_002928 [Linnemannia schmuckeri]|uniref:Uncharacterized protein n=1 Tax=Linnemannia schmuckeri TaxID=64567 RepID=A0A9P5S341_9FUNG|nr:hypothetical protein BG015_002928 [Linnemannia schmuckeri]